MTTPPPPPTFFFWSLSFFITLSPFFFIFCCCCFFGFVLFPVSPSLYFLSEFLLDVSSSSSAYFSVFVCLFYRVSVCLFVWPCLLAHLRLIFVLVLFVKFCLFVYVLFLFSSSFPVEPFLLVSHLESVRSLFILTQESVGGWGVGRGWVSSILNLMPDRRGRGRVTHFLWSTINVSHSSGADTMQHWVRVHLSHHVSRPGSTDPSSRLLAASV